ncbi:MAG TPA: cyclic nucleotide-binding domain-containing protein [Solirubrobacterales bacterium]|nr:cyclic nucleotide-binding domain-containing protein [Solirubrobacterales bacterium]
MDVSQLKRIPLFEAIPDEDLKTIAPFAVSEEYPDGAVVVQEGGFSNHFYGIEDGTAKVERDGQEVGQLGPGDVFGEQGLLEKQERSASVVATSALKVIKIEHWELSRMKKTMPEVVEKLRKQVEERSG